MTLRPMSSAALKLSGRTMKFLCSAGIRLSQRGQRRPEVEACGTLMARGYPFLTGNMRRMISESCRREKNELTYRPFEKFGRNSVVSDNSDGRRSRTRLKSCDGMTSPRSGGFADDFNCVRSSSRLGFHSRLPPMFPTSPVRAFYNPFVHAPNPYANRCSCIRY